MSRIFVRFTLHLAQQVLTNRQGQILFCEKLPDDASAVSEANGTTVSVSLDLGSSLSIQPSEGSRSRVRRTQGAMGI
jgi:hypothetical protein